MKSTTSALIRALRQRRLEMLQDREWQARRLKEHRKIIGRDLVKQICELWQPWEVYREIEELKEIMRRLEEI